MTRKASWEPPNCPKLFFFSSYAVIQPYNCIQLFVPAGERKVFDVFLFRRQIVINGPSNRHNEKPDLNELSKMGSEEITPTKDSAMFIKGNVEGDSGFE